MAEHLVVIGNGMAAMRMVETLWTLAPERYRITVAGREPYGNYNRIQLSPVLSGEKSFAETLLHTPEWYQQRGITLLSGEEVLSLDLPSKTASTACRTLHWDQLVLATGSEPAMPFIAGIEQPHVSGFRKLADVEQMLADDGPVVVLGGGLLGVEAAAALRLRGRSVTLLHRNGWLMDRQLDAKAGELLAETLTARGIVCRMNSGIQHIGSRTVTLTDGSQLAAARVIVAAGVMPALSLAQQAGLACNRGVVVDRQFRTSVPEVSAIGECCEIEGETFGLVAPCLAQAVLLAQRLAGAPVKDFYTEDNGTRLKVTGIEIFSAGEITQSPGTLCATAFDPTDRHYRRLFFRQNRLTGILLYGDISDAVTLLPLMQNSTPTHTSVLFDPTNPAQPQAAGSIKMSKPTLVVIGHGMVGHHFLEQLVARQLHQQYHIVVYGEERHVAYDRVHLSDYFAGKGHAELSLVAGNFFADHGIELRTHRPVVAVDRERRCVREASGHEMSWDKLVLATGSYAFVPPIAGNDSPGCFVYRTLDDLDAIAAKAQHSRRGVVIGGGLLGLEAANALKQLGLETEVVEFAPRLMAVQLDEGGAGMLRRKIAALGVRVHTSKATQSIETLEEGKLRLNFADGSTLESDLVLFSAGIRPRDRLAAEAGLALGARGGIIIDTSCATSDEDIFAIGECALWQEQIFGLVAPGYQMARVVADTLAGEASQFSGADMSTKLKLLGVEVASFGDAHGRTPHSQSYSWHNEPQEIYKKIVLSADGKRLLGGVLVGDSSDYNTLLQLMLNSLPLPSQPETLILPAMEGAPVRALGVAALPESAQVCSCHNVSKGDLCAAVSGGCGDMASLKSCTRAATGCGGCAALVKQVMEHQLSTLGVEVKKDICEHFAFSRQQLHHLIRVEEIKTFDALLEKHGHGLGCEVCKPLVGSLLASTWNEYLLKPQHLPLQDTNDRYFANIQKDGTYSVVPRIPAGEITPQGLIAIGEIAQRYNLYSKITGGQRIDLFGATLDQLPEIWQQLLAAGFETGHAYGKSLRTVKSCVGSTWCRYGVQDSTRFAIDLENRYKGLRAPHKIKMAVSGCTRECAEAQSKDIGVIATEKGWNLYVCGNGGMKPRHADLFASDLDDATLIRYVDRLLMFYIRTADRLQRTSVWMDNMEGGLAYLREVVIGDSLGIAAELEQEMARVVASWQCEWQTTLADPERLALFHATVNSTKPDESVRWSQQRGQIRPASDPLPHFVSGEVLPWTEVCRLDEIPPQAGIGARFGGERIALFRLNNEVFALEDKEPGTGASVLSRGILGDSAGEAMVVSPLYKQRFRLRDGLALDNSGTAVRCWPVKVEGGRVLIATPEYIALQAEAS
ncbi:nitrite reductase large subunit NirB [Erwinia sp. MMLR14_017]|uniref:nitrite reductase large subunit NirB n=1 Tax=Erwinia sp. MMLR14_017 TaxID=3093842 RepID=UPI0029903680|nr:nitrite reductase large subunit NirB [Erwinia sp. MMLR14_017]MDW8847381.1 nitrite reductase large subunit NirB [Erwinia sp. MMLR14_017]